MKYIITEDQLEKVKDKILKINFQVFDNDWNILQNFLNRRGNPPYIITDDVNLLENKEITTLGNLISVGGFLYLRGTSIESLGNLTSVGGFLYLRGTPIESLGDLTHVGGDLYLDYTPISKKYTAQQIRYMVKVDGSTYI